jgi:hypothetical protein
VKVACQDSPPGESDVTVRFTIDAGAAGGRQFFLSAFLPPDATSPNNMRAFDGLIGAGAIGPVLINNLGLTGGARWSYDYRVRRLETPADGSLVLSAARILLGVRQLADGSCRVATLTLFEE